MHDATRFIGYLTVVLTIIAGYLGLFIGSVELVVGSGDWRLPLGSVGLIACAILLHGFMKSHEDEAEQD